MKQFRPIIAIVCFIVSFTANAGEELTSKAKCVVNQPTNAELQLLQGTWEGVMVDQEKDGKITITLDTSLRLDRFFVQSERFWLNVRTECDLCNAKQLVARVAREVHPLRMAVCVV